MAKSTLSGRQCDWVLGTKTALYHPLPTMFIPSTHPRCPSSFVIFPPRPFAVKFTRVASISNSSTAAKVRTYAPSMQETMPGSCTPNQWHKRNDRERSQPGHYLSTLLLLTRRACKRGTQRRA